MSNADDEVSTVARSSPFARGGKTAYELTVLEGKERGRAITVDPARPTRVLVGQGPACELRLSDPMASRRHASLEVTGDLLRIVDLSSKNGTLVNGIRVVEALLAGGERVEIGQTVLGVGRLQAHGQPALPLATSFGSVVGASREMRRLYPLCERLANSHVPVVIEGETGTGKEALAEALHESGPRREGPFLVFDCTAIPGALLEAELFGHERGAFTGAVGARPGLFEAAHGGTLLIDEIGDLDLLLQPKLLRAIERSEVRRIGATKSKRVDVRILAATRRDLDKEVQAGRFRDDLFHRLAVARIELPPLRQRTGDVRYLARLFCTQMKGDATALTETLLQSWEEHPWPGNVRELRNAVARRLALGDLEQIERSGPLERADHGTTKPEVTDPVERVLALDLPLADSRRMLLAEFEQRYLRRVLERHGGHVGRSAAAAGVAKRHFQRLKSRT